MVKKLLAGSLLAALMVAPGAFAQDAPELVNVLTVRTKLGQQQEYEALLKDIWGAFKKAGVEQSIFVSSSASEPGAYTFVTPFSTWTEFGELNAKINQGFSSIPMVMQKMASTYTHTETEVWAARPDLSYTPANPRLVPDEGKYTRISFFYPHPDKALNFESVVQKFNALNEKHGNTSGSAVFQLAVGPDAPAYAVLIDGKDEADYFAEAAKFQQKTAAEAQAIIEGAGEILRRIEYEGTIPRLDLSYQP